MMTDLDNDRSCSNCALRIKELDRLRREISSLRCCLEKNGMEVPSTSDIAVQVGSDVELVDNNTQTINMFEESISNSDSSSSSIHEDEIEAASIVSDNQSGALCSISNAYINDQSNNELVIPFTVFPGQPFVKFNVHELEKTTKFGKLFKNRLVANYGDYPYSYGGITHQALPIKENKTLCDILSHLKQVIPNAQFNGALLTKFNNGKSNLPYHSDNEQEIVANSEIITIVLGQSRAIKFRPIKNNESELSTIIPHGSVYTMSRLSQDYFEHSIPADYSQSTRISITLRLLAPAKENNSNEANDQEVDSTDNTDSHEEHLQAVDSLQSGSPLTVQAHEDNPSNFPCNINTTFYISSSMFRKLDTRKLSSKSQRAEVAFYPGANAGQMLARFKRDVMQNTNSWDFSKVKTFMLLTGTNNVDSIMSDQSATSLNNAISDIDKLVSYLHSLAPSASINLINILPRNSSHRNSVINQLNSHLYFLSQEHPNINYVNTELNRSLFSTIDGYRRNYYFAPSTNRIPDNVHLNDIGVVRLAKHLKYFAHQIQN